MGIESAVFQTMVYYDLFDYPLTSVELWKYLITAESYSLAEVIQTATEHTEIALHCGFFCIKGKEWVVDERIKRYKNATRFRKKLLRWKWIFRSMPFLRAVYISGPLAQDAPHKDSDIDLVLFSKHNKLWTSRFFMVLLLKLLRARPQYIPALNKMSGKNTGKLCCNLWVSDEKNNLEPYALSPEDPHFALWLKHISPMWVSQEQVSKKFVHDNSWIKKLAEFSDTSTKYKHGYFTQRLFEKIVSIVPDVWYQRLQWALMPLEMKKKAQSKDTSVVVRRNCAKLHVTDKRDYYNRAWRERIYVYDQPR